MISNYVLVAFALSFFQTLGWIYFDGRKRRNVAYREKVSRDLSKFPKPQKELLAALFYPQGLHARWIQAMVIGSCSLILALPFYFPLCWYLSGRPWECLAAIVIGSYLAANLGELTLNR